VEVTEFFGRDQTLAHLSFALPWLLAQKPLTVPIAGTRKLERLEENLDSVNVKFTPDDLNRINAEAAKIAVQVTAPTARRVSTELKYRQSEPTPDDLRD
jgi:aryl-alcohol dehydrogenase-like predicted oxidoreductase